jgi:hypothetical protein
MADELVRGYCTTPDTIFKSADSGGRAAWLAGRVWNPGDTVTVAFLNSVGNYPDLVMKHVKDWEAIANIKFQFVNDSGAAIRISFTSALNQFYAFVGKDMLTNHYPDGHNMSLGFQTNLNYGDREIRRLILHEFGHALGLIHEHQRPDAGSFFQDPQVVYSFYAQTQGWDQKKVNDNILNVYSQKSIGNSTVFDNDSIMLYSFPPEITTRPTKVNYDISTLDRTLVGQLYPKEVLGRPLTLGTPENAVHLRAEDPDFYNFEVKTAGTYVIETTGDDSWVVILFPRSGQDMAIDTQEGNVDGINTRISQKLDPAVYYISVKSPDTSRPPSRYSLVVRQA